METSLQWVPEQPDLTRADLTFYTDGSMRFGPWWPLRRTGCTVVAVDATGALVAYAAASPPPWLRMAAAAELWAVLLLQAEFPGLPSIITDCQSIP